ERGDRAGQQDGVCEQRPPVMRHARARRVARLSRRDGHHVDCRPLSDSTAADPALVSASVTSAARWSRVGLRSHTNRAGMNAQAYRVRASAPKCRAEATNTSGSTIAEYRTWLR